MTERDQCDDSRAEPAENSESHEWREYGRQFQMSSRGYASFEKFQQAILDLRAALTSEERGLVQTWLEIGRRNVWISQAIDPPFTELSFRICRDFRDLADRLLSGNWSLGTAFALENICFINKINGGDEWLTIRGAVPFESITMQTFRESREAAETRLAETIGRIRRATDEQLRNLEY